MGKATHPDLLTSFAYDKSLRIRITMKRNPRERVSGFQNQYSISLFPFKGTTYILLRIRSVLKTNTPCFSWWLWVAV